MLKTRFSKQPATAPDITVLFPDICLIIVAALRIKNQIRRKRQIHRLTKEISLCAFASFASGYVARSVKSRFASALDLPALLRPTLHQQAAPRKFLSRSRQQLEAAKMQREEIQGGINQARERFAAEKERRQQEAERERQAERQRQEAKEREKEAQREKEKQATLERLQEQRQKSRGMGFSR